MKDGTWGVLERWTLHREQNIMETETKGPRGILAGFLVVYRQVVAGRGAILNEVQWKDTKLADVAEFEASPKKRNWSRIMSTLGSGASFQFYQPTHQFVGDDADVSRAGENTTATMVYPVYIGQDGFIENFLSAIIDEACRIALTIPRVIAFGESELSTLEKMEAAKGDKKK